jgi:hypothetical protein
MMMEFNMVPSMETEERFVNRIRDTLHIKKAVTFGDSDRSTIMLDDPTLDEKCQLYFNNMKGDEPWFKDRPSHRERDAKVLYAWMD